MTWAANSALGPTTTSTAGDNWLASFWGPAIPPMKFTTRLDSYNLSFTRYCIFASFWTFIMSVLIGVSYRYFVDGVNLLAGSRRFSLPLQPWNQFLTYVVVGPLIETAISQWLLISLLMKAKLPKSYIVAFGGVLFSLWHLHIARLSAINTLFLGFVLCYSYIYWLERTRSTRMAFEAALLIHAAHNSYHLVLMLWQRV